MFRDKVFKFKDKFKLLKRNKTWALKMVENTKKVNLKR